MSAPNINNLLPLLTAVQNLPSFQIKLGNEAGVADLAGLLSGETAASGDFFAILNNLLSAGVKLDSAGKIDLETLKEKLAADAAGATDDAGTGQDKDNQLSSELLLYLLSVVPQPDLEAILPQGKLEDLINGAKISDDAGRQKILDLITKLIQETQITQQPQVQVVTPDPETPAPASNDAGNPLVNTDANDTGTKLSDAQPQESVFDSRLIAAALLKNRITEILAKNNNPQKTQDTTAQQDISGLDSNLNLEAVSEGAKTINLLLETVGQAPKNNFSLLQNWNLKLEDLLPKNQTQASDKAQAPVLESKYLNLSKIENLFENSDLNFGTGKETKNNIMELIAAVGNKSGDLKSTQEVFDINTKIQADSLEDSIKAKDLIDQFVQKIDTALKGKVQEAYIELKPDYLGRAFIKVSLENGKVSIRMEVSSVAVKETLESNFSMLKDSLRDKGFTMDNFKVSVNSDARGNNPQPREQLWQPDAPSYGWVDSLESGGEESLATAATAEVLSAKSYPIGIGDINYLI